jgi:hypothetical protein
MAISSQTILGGLLVLNIALYAPLVFAALRRRRHRVAATNLVEAFNGLELALKSAVPDLPAGFTWEEAVGRLKASGVWTVEMEAALKGYEAYRYGGAPLPDIDFRDVVRVANMLGRNAVRGTDAGSDGSDSGAGPSSFSSSSAPSTATTAAATTTMTATTKKGRATSLGR